MFAKTIGKRTTALATSLAVVVGLAITPAFTATAAEGDEPAVVETTPAPLAVVPPAEPPVEEPPAETPPAEAPPAAEPPAEEPPAEESPAEKPSAVEPPAKQKPAEEPSTEKKPAGSMPTPMSVSAPPAEPVEAPAGDESTPPAPQNLMRGSTMGVQSMGTQSFGVQSTSITPTSLPSEFLLGQPLDVQFGGVDADRWTMNWDFLSNANLTDSGHLTGYFSRPGWHTLTVRAQERHTFWGITYYETIETKKYDFHVVPAVLTSSLPDATVGTAYNQVLDAADYPEAHWPSSTTFSLKSGSLPPGLSLNSDGKISGTVTSIPDNPKTYTFDVGVSVWVLLAGTHQSAPKTLSITVGYQAPTWNSITLPDATVGVAYPATSVSANGNGWPVGTYTASGLPDGLELSADGVISGTPELNPAYGPIETVNVTFTADNGRTTSTTANIVVNTPPTFVTPNPLPSGVVGTPYTTTIETAGPAVTYSLTRGPVGMVIDSATGELSGWTPTDETNVRVGVKAENLAGNAVLVYTMKPFAVPVVTSTAVVNGIIGQSYTDQILFTGRNGKLVKTAGVLPNGVTLKNGTAASDGGLLNGTPTELGDFTFTVTVSNLAGTTTQDFTLTVTEPATTLSTNNIIRGSTLTVNGTGYLPGDSIELWLHSTPVLLGTTVTTDGTFTKSVKIPANTAPGAHSLVVVGAQSGTTSTPLTVSSPPAPPAPPQSNTPQSQGPQLTVTPGDDESEESTTDDSETEEVEGTDEAEAGADGEELPTLSEPETEEEAAAETPANLSWLLYAGFAALLAALLLWFILWRRRRATES